MTVKELIEKLETMPQEYEVQTEGCDCYGDAADVTIEDWESKPFVCIIRGKKDDTS